MYGYGYAGLLAKRAKLEEGCSVCEGKGCLERARTCARNAFSWHAHPLGTGSCACGQQTAVDSST